MKIVKIDNFARESVADYLVAENVCEFYGKEIVEFLNRKEGDNSPDYFILVENDHRLHKGLEDLV